MEGLVPRDIEKWHFVFKMLFFVILSKLLGSCMVKLIIRTWFKLRIINNARKYNFKLSTSKTPTKRPPPRPTLRSAASPHDLSTFRMCVCLCVRVCLIPARNHGKEAIFAYMTTNTTCGDQIENARHTNSHTGWEKVVFPNSGTGDEESRGSCSFLFAQPIISSHIPRVQFVLLNKLDILWLLVLVVSLFCQGCWAAVLCVGSILSTDPQVDTAWCLMLAVLLRRPQANEREFDTVVLSIYEILKVWRFSSENLTF